MTSAAIAIPIAQTLAYQSGLDQRDHRKRGLGVASLVCWVVTCLYVVVCLIGASRATGWDGLGWVLFALLGSWVGCGLGLVFGIAGVFPRRRRARFALAGLILNLVCGVGPITWIWLVSAMN